MAIVKMKKLRVMAMADRREALLRALLRLGCVEDSEPDGLLEDPAWSALLQRGFSRLADTKTEINGVNIALEAIQALRWIERRTVHSSAIPSRKRSSSAPGRQSGPKQSAGKSANSCRPLPVSRVRRTV